MYYLHEAIFKGKKEKEKHTQDAIYDLSTEVFCWFHHFFSLIGRNKNSLSILIAPTKRRAAEFICDD